MSFFRLHLQGSETYMSCGLLRSSNWGKPSWKPLVAWEAHLVISVSGDPYILCIHSKILKVWKIFRRHSSSKSVGFGSLETLLQLKIIAQPRIDTFKGFLLLWISLIRLRSISWKPLLSIVSDITVLAALHYLLLGLARQASSGAISPIIKENLWPFPPYWAFFSQYFSKSTRNLYRHSCCIWHNII